MPKASRGSASKCRSRATVQQQSIEPDGLWSVAMLRIALELKRPGSRSLDTVIDEVVAKMGIRKDDFEKYLTEHLGLLRQAVKEKLHS